MKLKYFGVQQIIYFAKAKMVLDEYLCGITLAVAAAALDIALAHLRK